MSQFFQSILDETDKNLIIADREGRIIFANKQTLSYRKQSLENILEKKPGELWGGKMTKDYYKKLWQSISQKKRFINSVKNNGVKEDLLIIPIQNKEQKIKYYLGINALNLKSERLKKDLHHMELNDFFAKWLISKQNLDFEECLNQSILTQANILTDKTLLSLSKDEPFFYTAVYSKYFPKILRYLEFKVGNSAFDLTQETFLRAFQSEFKYRGAGYESYLRTIAHNLMVNHYKKESRPLTFKPSVQEECTLEKIPEILKKYYIEGYSIKELAQQRDKSINAVKLSLSRARKKAKSLLEYNCE